MPNSLVTQKNMKDNQSFSKLVIDRIKKNDLKQIYQILMILPCNRTIADLNSLSKIILNIQPIKQIKNLSSIYHCCQSMYLSKYKQKDFIFQKKQDSQSLYILLTGKIGLYKRSSEEYQQEEVVFLDQGSCFGRLFNWKVRFLPLALEETLIAILPKRDFNKISVMVNIQTDFIIKEIKHADIIPSYITQEKLMSISHTFVINRIPHGHYLIKSGQTPKVIFLILKGMVKKVIQIPKQNQQNLLKQSNSLNQVDSYSVSHYSAGDYFPRNNLNSPANFSLISECPSQIVTIPKKSLKQIGYRFDCDKNQQKKDSQYYKDELKRQFHWQKYKNSVVNDVILKNQMKKKSIFP